MDTYLTIESPGAGLYKDKGSKFIASAVHIASAEEALAHIEAVRRQYHDARHCCWAYMLGPDRLIFRSNDDGEPSGTAGRPILGQINSAGLTDVLVTVVRYFGGILLGTSGLIVAYREASAEAIRNAVTVEKIIENLYTIEFGYEQMSYVMRTIKELNARIEAQRLEAGCTVSVSLRRDADPALAERLTNQKGISFKQEK